MDRGRWVGGMDRGRWVGGWWSFCGDFCCADPFGLRNQNALEVKNERFFIIDWRRQCANFRHPLPLNKATNGQTDIKHELGEKI